MGNLGKAERMNFTIDQGVGVRDNGGTLTHIGRYQGVYISDKFKNKDYALVRLPTHKDEAFNKMFQKLLKEEILFKVTQSLVTLPLNILEPCDKIIKRRGKYAKRKR